MKFKVFISSVRNEFSDERLAIANYLRSDILLKLFFEPFLFEEVAATEYNPSSVYLSEVSNSEIYIGLFGQEYGYEFEDGESPTEKEYNEATQQGLSRWIYIKDQGSLERHYKMQKLIEKAGKQVSWKRFHSLEQLEKEVYRSCIVFLKQKGLVTTLDFDQSLLDEATINDIDPLLVAAFVVQARQKRNFPLAATAPVKDVLTHLNLLRNGKLVNSALLIFSYNPQKYFPSATIKCAHFHGLTVQKPIPDYKEYKGTVYNQIDQAVDFVLSKISLTTGTRTQGNAVDTYYEVPRAAISEAIINAVAHRDYISKASIHISVFKDRIEIQNPGSLPKELSIDTLGQPHQSYPQNLNLADCLFQTGTIERYGTGIVEIYQLSEKRGLNKPTFNVEEGVSVTLWRPSATVQVTDQVTEQVTDQVTDQVEISYASYTSVERVVLVMDGEMRSSELLKKLDLRHRGTFRDNYLLPAIQEGLVEMTIPDKPQSSKQQYRLTQKGILFKEGLQKL